MKRTVTLFLTPLVCAGVYWVLASYFAMSEQSIGLMAALFAAPLKSKIIIALSILIGGTILNVIAVQKEPTLHIIDDKDEMKEFQNAITIILFSPTPLSVRVRKALALTEQVLHLSSIIVGIYGKDKIDIIAQTQTAQTLMIDEKIKPYKPETHNHPIEKMIATCFIEKRAHLFETIELANGKNHVINLALKTDQAIRPFGIVSAIVPPNQELSELERTLLDFVVDSIAFAVNITYKKDAILEANVQFYQQNNEIDNDLGIYTNTKLQKVLEHEIRRHKRYHTPLSILLFEIDHFRNLCNIFSVDESDKIRKEFASVIKSHIRDTDIFGKWVDQQFAIIIADLDFKAANTLAMKLTEVLKKQHFTKVGKLTCSFGVTSYSPKDTLGIFRKRAENALEIAKKSGGNRIETKLLV